MSDDLFVVGSPFVVHDAENNCARDRPHPLSTCGLFRDAERALHKLADRERSDVFRDAATAMEKRIMDGLPRKRDEPIIGITSKESAEMAQARADLMADARLRAGSYLSLLLDVIANGGPRLTDDQIAAIRQTQEDLDTLVAADGDDLRKALAKVHAALEAAVKIVDTEMEAAGGLT